MDFYALVRREHLNHQGFLFGGQLLSWVDEYTWIAATLDFPKTKFVTRAVSDANFVLPIPEGSIVHFLVTLKKKNTTSIQYETKVFFRKEFSATEFFGFSSEIVFVAVNSEGKKCSILDASHNLIGTAN